MAYRLTFILFISLALNGCWFGWWEVKLPAPESFVIENTAANVILAEVDQWTLKGKGTLDSGSYLIPYDNDNITIKIENNTKFSIDLMANMAPYKQIDKGIEIAPAFDTFLIKASKPIKVGLGNNEMISVQTLSHKNGDINLEARLHIANALGYVLSRYILKEEIVSEGLSLFSFKLDSFTVIEAAGIFLPDSQITIDGHQITMTGGGTVALSSFTQSSKGDLFSDISISAGNVYINSQSESSQYQIQQAGFRIDGQAHYHEDHFTITSQPNNIGVNIGKVQFISENDTNFSLNGLSLNAQSGSFSFNRRSESSKLNFDALLFVDFIQQSGEIQYTITGISPLKLSIDHETGVHGIVLSSEFPLQVQAKDILFSSGKTLKINSATLTIDPFEISRPEELKLTMNALVIDADTIEYGLNSDKEHLIVHLKEPLELTLNQPLVIGYGENNQGFFFSTQTSISSFTLIAPDLPKLDFNNTLLSLDGTVDGFEGSLGFESGVSTINNVAITTLAKDAYLKVPEIGFEYGKQTGLLLTGVKMELSLPQSNLETAIRQVLAEPTEPKYGGVPGRDATRLLSAFTVKDTRTRSNIYGVHLGTLSLEGNHANVTVGGAIRTELHADVLTTRMENKVISKKRPCIRKNRWGIHVPTTCNDPIKTKVPVTSHEWKQVAAATVKAGVGGRVRFNPSINSSLDKLSFNPTLKITSVDIKHIPGFVDKEFLTPLVYLFVSKQELDPVYVFEDIDPNIKAILERLNLDRFTVNSENGNIVLRVNASLSKT